MSRFFLGQRVRIVSTDRPRGSSVVDCEGHVNELDCVDDEGRGGQVGVTVDGDPDWCFWPHELEPILPEGAAPSEFRTLADLLKSIGAEVKA